MGILKNSPAACNSVKNQEVSKEVRERIRQIQKQVERESKMLSRYYASGGKPSKDQR